MEKKYQKNLFQQANLQQTFYNYSSQLQPCAYFLRQLTRSKQTPSILIPDTLLINDKQNPLIWIYTNNKGKLQRSTNINYKDFVNKITNYCSPNQLTAVLKRITYNDHYINGNDIKLLNARYLQNSSLQQVSGQSQTIITLQKYVKCNGNNSFICRTIWKNNKNSLSFIVTNKKSFYDQNQNQSKKFTIKISDKNYKQYNLIKTIQGKHLQQTSKVLENIVNFMKLYRGVFLSEIVGDFIKDEAGNWWLLNIKAFQIEQKIVKNPNNLTKSRLNLGERMDEPHNLSAVGNSDLDKALLQQKHQKQKQKYQKTKICRYCQKSYLESDLTHYMTIKMLIQTDRYLLHLGKDYNWLKRSDIQNVDSYCLYQQHKICERCYRLYTEIQQLMEVEKEFLKRLGFQIEKTPKELLMSLTNEEQLKNQSKSKEIMQLGELMKNQKKINVNASMENKENGLGESKTTSNINNTSFNNNQTPNPNNISINSSFPCIIQLGPNSKITIHDDCPLKNDQMINKMIRYRMIFYLKQIDQIKIPQNLMSDSLTNPSNQYNFYLQYQLFNIKNRIKLDFNSNYNQEKRLLSIKKLKINYFFSHSHQDVYKYLKNQVCDFVLNIVVEDKGFALNTKNGFSSFIRNSSKKPTINGQQSIQMQKSRVISVSKQKNKKQKLRQSQYQRQKTKQSQKQKQKRFIIGKLRLPVKDIFSNIITANPNKITKKDFYKFFSVDNVSHGWGLEGSIGIIPSQSYVNTTRMIFFTKDHLIYLPSKDYYCCQHLPQEWIDLIRKELPPNHRESLFFYENKHKKTYVINKELRGQEKDGEKGNISMIQQNHSKDKSSSVRNSHKSKTFAKKSKFYQNYQVDEKQNLRKNQTIHHIISYKQKVQTCKKLVEKEQKMKKQQFNNTNQFFYDQFQSQTNQIGQINIITDNKLQIKQQVGQNKSQKISITESKLINQNNDWKKLLLLNEITQYQNKQKVISKKQEIKSFKKLRNTFDLHKYPNTNSVKNFESFTYKNLKA